MKKHVIVIPISPQLKAQLDAMRAKGYTINGYTRAALERALAGEPIPRAPRRTRRAA